MRLSGPSGFHIDYGIRADRFAVVSYVDLLEGRVDPDLFTGKIVFIGATALELGDIAATPVNGLSMAPRLQSTVSKVRAPPRRSPSLRSDIAIGRAIGAGTRRALRSSGDRNTPIAEWPTDGDSGSRKRHQ
jgi:hypothetical protein